VTPFGQYNVQELKLMVECGLTPLQVIKAATSANAELLGFDDLGTLAEGMRADLLVVKGALAEDIDPLQDKDNILAIIKDGRRMPRLKDCQPQ
jgi:imidazolonepropionase-like amidohydrolase